MNKNKTDFGFRKFGQDVSKIAIGTVLSQLILALTSPILTRLYSPELIGMGSLLLSITNMAGLLSCFRYDVTIPLPEKDEDSSSLFILSLLFAILSTILSVIIIFFFGDIFLTYIRADVLIPYKWYIPPSILLIGISSVFSSWETRKQRFSILALRKIVRNLSTVAWQIIIGFSTFRSEALYFASLFIGWITSNLILGLNIFKNDYKVFSDKREISSFLHKVKEFSDFPKFGLVAVFLNSLSSNVPAFLLNFFFNPKIVGFWGITNSVINLPMELIGNSISKVFFPKAASLLGKEQFSYFVKNIYEKLVKISMFPMIALSIYGDLIVKFVFGDNWTTAGYFLQIVSPSIIFWFITSPISNLLAVFRKQKSLLYFNIIILVFRLVSIILGGVTNSYINSIIFYSVSSALIYSGLNIKIMVWSGISIMESAKIFFRYVLFSIPFILVTLISKIIIKNNLLSLLALSITTFLYFIILILNDKDFLQLFQKGLNDGKKI